MKKKVVAVMMSLALCASLMMGCGSAETKEAAENTETEETVETVEEEATEVEAEDETATEVEETTESEEVTDEEAVEETAEAAYEAVDINVGSLKGPTSIGLVYLMDQAKNGEAANNYNFTMATAADELLPKMISGEMDIVLVPANVASVLYNKTEGGVSVIDINTLGVLYMVSGDSSIQTMTDLKGKTIYLTGKGTTPDYVLQYLLTENGMTTDDVTLEYKSEATEVAAVLAENPDAIGVLPQPFVTAACIQNEALTVVMDLNAEWNAVQGEGGSSLVTGVTVVRNEFLAENPEAVAKFMEEHEASAAYANENVEAAAELVAAEGIIEKAPVAAKAMPKCNITYIDGEDMKTALSGYLEVLFNQDASSVGGSLPADDFYYIQ
ncbi:MAG: ABC transporter substrate-binding protein [Lachnospiraceae bacterium]|nr:ABC transporter substrate-binding protein [Lachnospiraceae bacterium]